MESFAAEDYGPSASGSQPACGPGTTLTPWASSVRIAFTEQTRPPGPMRKHLPDLIVRWADTAAAQHRRLVSERYGSIQWETPGRHPSGRAGNHRRNGFLITAGGAFEGGQIATKASIVDLADGMQGWRCPSRRLSREQHVPGAPAQWRSRCRSVQGGYH